MIAELHDVRLLGLGQSVGRSGLPFGLGKCCAQLIGHTTARSDTSGRGRPFFGGCENLSHFRAVATAGRRRGGQQREQDKRN